MFGCVDDDQPRIGFEIPTRHAHLWGFGMRPRDRRNRGGMLGTSGRTQKKASTREPKRRLSQFFLLNLTNPTRKEDDATPGWAKPGKRRFALSNPEILQLQQVRDSVLELDSTCTRIRKSSRILHALPDRCASRTTCLSCIRSDIRKAREPPIGNRSPGPR